MSGRRVDVLEEGGSGGEVAVAVVEEVAAAVGAAAVTCTFESESATVSASASELYGSSATVDLLLESTSPSTVRQIAREGASTSSFETRTS